MTAPIRTMPELIDALKQRARELNIAYGTIDEVAGLPDRYTSKLFAPTPIKNLGPMSFGAVLGALGVTVVLVEDQEQCKRVSGRWAKRKRAHNATLSIPLSMPNEVPFQIQITPELQSKLRDPEFMKSIGKLGGKRRMKTMGKRARQRAASHAARVRWSKRANAAS